MSDEKYMRECLRLARLSALEGEVPVGAIVVATCDIFDAEGAPLAHAGDIIGRGRNRREKGRCATAHAEIEAIGKACRRIHSWRLQFCELFVTLEPCPMCAGAAINSRISRVIFGAADKKAGCFGSLCDLNEVAFNHHPEVVGGVLAAPCGEILTGFFRELRKR